MPLSGVVLGLAFDVSANASNPLALVASAPMWASIGSAWVAHLQSSATFGPLGLVCPSTGGALTGTTTIGGMNAEALGTAIAAASLAAASAPQWIPIAQAFITYVKTNATVSPSTTLLAPAGSPTSGGLITGTGVISGLVGNDLGDAMATAAGTIDDAVSKAAWRSMAADLVTQIHGAGVAGAGTLSATSGGGPIIVGSGVLM